MTRAPFVSHRRRITMASASLLSGLSFSPAQAQSVDLATGMPAQRVTEPVGQRDIVAIPVPLPLPGQLKPLPVRGARLIEPDPKVRVVVANAAARVQPASGGFLNAIQQYPWTEGALYELYTAPGQVTDIALQEGEQLVGAGPVAAGDTVRWIIGDTTSGAGTTNRVHILVKPTRSDLTTNLVINTDRRTYHLELRATPATYMASVSWTYPQDQLIALRRQNTIAVAAAPIAAGVDVGALEFGYAIEGDSPAWRPLRAFDDGQQIFIEFPATIGQGEMPPLFVIGASGAGELVNYRVRDRFMIVDRRFATAELRMGGKKGAETVRIVRSADTGRKGRK
ncbi:P-type conjugative transfer protein TrbG [Sphingomonas sp. GB1N7]|uniref:P-type conjugative transfer protein TrbG n=1 Tax=Parasphingomonas caseinilytica TaxID=3096158 RepID=UPI003FA70BDF